MDDEGDRTLEAIKKRPALYNPNHENYKNMEIKDKLWRDVVREVYSEVANQLSEEEIGALKRKFKSRWGNMRTYFLKELHYEQRVKNKEIRDDGKPLKRKKPYCYFNQLQFLINGLSDDETPPAINMGEQEDREDNSTDSETLSNIKLLRKVRSSPCNLSATENNADQELELHETDRVILAVKKRPSLYNANHPNYKHIGLRDKMWEEVCREVFPSKWDQMKGYEKREYQLAVKNRWRNVRSTFVKELQFQRKLKDKEGNFRPVKRKRRYRYFNQLKFLIEGISGDEFEPAIRIDCDGNERTNRMDTSDTSHKENNLKEEQIEKHHSDEDSPDDDPLCNIKTERDEGVESPPSVAESSFYEIENTGRAKCNTKTRCRPNEFFVEIPTFEETVNKEDDADKQFLLSLMSSFRKLNDKQKFEAKIGILKVLKDITFY